MNTLDAANLVPLVDAAAQDLFAQRSPSAQRAILERVAHQAYERGRRASAPNHERAIADHDAHEAYERGRHDALMSLRTQEEVAAILGVNPSVISRRARARGRGWQIGRGWLFLPEDIEALRPDRRRSPMNRPEASGQPAR